METYQYGLRRGGSNSDRLMKFVLLAVSSLAVLIVLLIILFTFGNSLTSMVENGLDFLFDKVWRPSTGEYGALPLMLGTILVTLGAMVFAVPIGVCCAIYISELAPAKVRTVLKPVVELFSAIPSVVYGFVGMVVLVPMLQSLFPDNQLYSASWLAASLVLGVMALPTVISVSEDAIHSVPQSYREASLAMGATKWETIVKVVVPAAISGISAAIILGIGRAIGETMAVMMLTGNSPVIPDPLWNIFSMISTITGTIALQLPETVAGSLNQSALFELGVILMVMVLIVNVMARYVVRRMTRKLDGYDPSGTLLYRITGGRGLVPSGVCDGLLEHRGAVLKVAVYVLVFIAAWMAFDLFAKDSMSLIGAAVVVVALALLSRAYSTLGSTHKQSLCFGGLTVVMGFVVLILAVIIGYVLLNGVSVIDWEFLTESPTSSGRDGGIFPAIVGSIELIAGTAAIAFPLGILTGIYLNEYAGNSRYTRLIREAIDLLNGTPSIIFGMFGMILFATYCGWGYSLVGGWITLAFMILPVIIRTTEEALKSVPQELREASRAMGATKWKTIYKVVLPAAMGGVVTGAILAIGRSAGETAPIMLVAASISQAGLASSIFDSVMALPLHLYHLAMDIPGSIDMQYGTATVLLVLVLAIFVAASAVRSHYNRKIRW